MDNSRPILLVEDDPRDAELARLILEECHGHPRIVTVPDGVEALDFLFRRGRFAQREDGAAALVLLDLKLPRLDGFEVLRQVKSDPVLRRVPIVVLSSSSQEADVSLAYQLGANAFVTKGIDFENHSRKLKRTAEFWLQVIRPPPTT